MGYPRGTDKPMTDCLKALISVALSIWREGRRANRPLWGHDQNLDHRWNFEDVSGDKTNEHVEELTSSCVDRQLMEEAFANWDDVYVVQQCASAEKVKAPIKMVLCSVVGS